MTFTPSRRCSLVIEIIAEGQVEAIISLVVIIDLYVVNFGLSWQFRGIDFSITSLPVELGERQDEVLWLVDCIFAFNF